MTNERDDSRSLCGILDDDTFRRLLWTAALLAVQGAVIVYGLQWKLDEQAREQERLVSELNEEHYRLWQALGKPEMYHGVRLNRRREER